MGKIFLFLALACACASAPAAPAAAGSGAVFSIGKPDACAAEFKFFRNLADDKYPSNRQDARKFRDVDGAVKFFKNPPKFVVGKSKDSDWSFVHPIRGCAWAGTDKPVKFEIEFEMPETKAEFLYLKIGIADTSERSDIGLAVSLNGARIAAKNGFFFDKSAPEMMPMNALAFHKNAAGAPSKPCVIEIKASAFKPGKNVIALEAHAPKNMVPRSGQWLVYDFIELSESPDYPKIANYADTLLPRAIKAMGTEEVLFCVSGGSRGGHWYENIGRLCEADEPHPLVQDRQGAENFSRMGARLVRFNLKTREYKVLLEDKQGGIRDLTLHYDAKKILFSYRKGDSDKFKLYEIDVDGGNLRQLPTNSEGNDVEPCYLPNGDIMFVSDRKCRTVQCWMTPATNLHRYFAKEKIVRCMSGNPDVDNTPYVLRDGRVVYMRWDYNHRSQMKFHHLWQINPDGTNNAIFYGNAFPHGVFLSPKQAPDSEDIIFAMSPYHGRTNHAGAIAKLTPPFDPSDPYALEFVRFDVFYNEPFPLKNNLILATSNTDIVVCDFNGILRKIPIPKELFETSGESTKNVIIDESKRAPIKCAMIARNIVPLAKRPRENARPDMADFSAKTSTVFLQDVYIGRNMGGVKRGSIKKLMILRVQPTPVNYTGIYLPTGFSGSFALEAVLGTVPVYEDGSAFFEVPANVGIAFVALDENNNCVKRMMSSTNFAPATQTSCVGCHERRTEAPVQKQKLPIAYRKGVSKIQKLAGAEEMIDFTRDIQPLLDKYCVECHNPQKPNGAGVILSRSIGRRYITPRIILQDANMCATDNDGEGDFPPYKFGSGGSRLARFAEGGHHNKKFSPQDMAILKAWLDIGAPQISTYASKGCGFPQAKRLRVYSDLVPVDAAMKKIFAQNCSKCHGPKATNGARYARFSYNGSSMMRAKKKDGTVKELHIPFDNIYNFIDPENSPALIVPLAKAAGGSAEGEEKGAHPVVFKDKNDPRFVQMLESIKDVAKKLDAQRPFITSKNFYPSYGYVRKMQECGVLPKNWGPKTPLDPYKIDQAYFRFQEQP